MVRVPFGHYGPYTHTLMVGHWDLNVMNPDVSNYGLGRSVFQKWFFISFATQIYINWFLVQCRPTSICAHHLSSG